MQIEDLGWDRYHHTIEDIKIPDPHNIGRVVIEHKQGLIIHTDLGEIEGIVPRKLVHRSDPLTLPKVGDWVVFEKLSGENKAIISEVLPRYSVLSRKEIGKKTKEQIIATNIDTVFIVMGFDDELNLALLERYLLLVKQSGAQPIVVLNKADLIAHPTNKAALARARIRGVPILTISAKSKTGLDLVKKQIKPHDTVVFVGSSGTGKSTLINALLGEDRQTVSAVRASDAKGRHTTTRREIIVLPTGGILIDTPGMRELGTLVSEDSLEKSFDDIQGLATLCQYRDCDHQKTDGCAVIAAMHSGELSKERYKNFLRLQKEIKQRVNIDEDRKTKTAKTKERRNARSFKKQLQHKYKNRH
jgi:ribosome biogenesis GTPase